jgi:hypothetical protein
MKNSLYATEKLKKWSNELDSNVYNRYYFKNFLLIIKIKATLYFNRKMSKLNFTLLFFFQTIKTQKTN